MGDAMIFKSYETYVEPYANVDIFEEIIKYLQKYPEVRGCVTAMHATLDGEWTVSFTDRDVATTFHMHFDREKNRGGINGEC
jgi:hypothetical protein